MVFSLNTEIIYQEMYGLIDFVCDNYVVLKLISNSGRNPARLIVYRENYKNIKIVKESNK